MEDYVMESNDTVLYKFLSQDYTITRPSVNFSHFTGWINFAANRREDPYTAYEYLRDTIKMLQKKHGKKYWFDYYLTYKLYKNEYDQLYNQNAFFEILQFTINPYYTLKDIPKSKYFKLINQKTRDYIMKDYDTYKKLSINALSKALRDTYVTIAPFVAKDKKCMPIAVLLYAARHIFKKNMIYFDKDFNVLKYNNLKGLSHVFFGYQKVIDVYPFNENDYVFYKNKYIEEFIECVQYYNNSSNIYFTKPAYE